MHSIWLHPSIRSMSARQFGFGQCFHLNVSANFLNGLFAKTSSHDLFPCHSYPHLAHVALLHRGHTTLAPLFVRSPSKSNGVLHFSFEQYLSVFMCSFKRINLVNALAVTGWMLTSKLTHFQTSIAEPQPGHSGGYRRFSVISFKSFSMQPPQNRYVQNSHGNATSLIGCLK